MSTVKLKYLLLVLFFPMLYLWTLDFPSVIQVVLVNPSFWIIFIFAFSYPVFRKLTTNHNYTWEEFLIHFYLFTVYFATVFTLYFVKSTDIINEKNVNSYVESAIYEEGWTEQYQERVCSGSRRSRSCHNETRTRYNFPRYYVILGDETRIDISEREFNNYVSYFQSKAPINIPHLGQISHGDGRAYIAKSEIFYVAASYKVNYLDYIHANGGTILQKRFNQSFPQYAQQLLEYPQIINRGYGHLALARIIDPLHILDDTEVSDNIQENLDKANIEYGLRQDLNLILYITHNTQPDFEMALLQHWKGLRDNDLIILLSVDREKEIQWVKALSLTPHENFLEELEKKILEYKLLDPLLPITIMTQLEVPSDAPNGYLKSDMQSYDYLKYNLSMPWYLNLWVFILFVVINIFVTHYLERNDVKLKKLFEE